MKDLSESRILIVDDAKTNIDILVQALRDEYKLSVAVDGAAALRSVEKSPPDLVLLDIVMPGLDGYEVCRRLRAQESTRELPIMFLSSLEDVKDKTRGFEVGGNDYLTKPFEVLEVKARVRSLLKAKAYADAIREAMARDLRIAREIQMGILPADLAAATSGTGLDVHAIIEPAQKVGGDLYEVLRASDDRLVVALGDVSGKGIPAALFMAVAVTILRTLARHIVDPAEILSRLNDELAEAESARHVRHDAMPGVRPRAPPRVVRGRRTPPARDPLARPSAAAGVSFVWPAGRADGVESHRARDLPARAGRDVCAVLRRRVRGDERGRGFLRRGTTVDGAVGERRDVGRGHGRRRCWLTCAHSSPARSNRMTSPSWQRAMRPRKADAPAAPDAEDKRRTAIYRSVSRASPSPAAGETRAMRVATSPTSPPRSVAMLR